MAKGSKSRGNGQEESQVVFEYIKSSYFRVIHADGAMGGITPTGFIHFALYSDRNAIPRKIVNAINPDGTLGPEVKEERVAREGVIREMDVDVIMNVDAAEQLGTWLLSKVAEYKSLTHQDPKGRKN